MLELGWILPNGYEIDLKKSMKYQFNVVDSFLDFILKERFNFLPTNLHKDLEEIIIDGFDLYIIAVEYLGWIQIGDYLGNKIIKLSGHEWQKKYIDLYENEGYFVHLEYSSGFYDSTKEELDYDKILKEMEKYGWSISG